MTSHTVYWAKCNRCHSRSVANPNLTIREHYNAEKPRWETACSCGCDDFTIISEVMQHLYEHDFKEVTL